MSGSKPAGTTVAASNNAPWSGAQPHLTRGFEQAQQQYETPIEYYPGETVVPFSQQTEAGLQAQEARALQGSPLNAAAQAEAQKVLSGDYLTAENPAFGAMAERIGREVRAPIDSQFAGAGRYGGAGHQEMMGRTMADALAPLAWKNYAAERGNMQQMAKVAPELAMSDYRDIAMLRDTGQAREGLAQQQLQADIDEFNFGQYEPIDRLARYMAMIQGGSTGFGQKAVSQPYYNNTSGNILGAGVAGAGILKNLFGAGGAFANG